MNPHTTFEGKDDKFELLHRFVFSGCIFNYIHMNQAYKEVEHLNVHILPWEIQNYDLGISKEYIPFGIRFSAEGSNRRFVG